MGKNAAIEAVLAESADFALLKERFPIFPGPSGKDRCRAAAAVFINPSAGCRSLDFPIHRHFLRESKSWAISGEAETLFGGARKKRSGPRAFEEEFSLRAPVNGILKSLVPEDRDCHRRCDKRVKSTQGADGFCLPAPGGRHRRRAFGRRPLHPCGTRRQILSGGKRNDPRRIGTKRKARTRF